MLRFFTFLIVCTLHTTSTWCQKVTLTSNAVKCNGGNDGTLTINTKETNATYVLRVMLAKNNRLVFEKTFNTDTLVQVKNLKAESYLVRLSEMGKVFENIHTITQPEPLTANVIEIVSKLSAENSCDAVAKAVPSGGTVPYSYKWSENTGGKETSELSGLCKGIYRCIINDSNNCREVSATVFIIVDKENQNLSN